MMHDLSRACPDCETPLGIVHHGESRAWSCMRCGGSAVAISTLRRERDTAIVSRLWGAARAPGAAPGRACVICARTTARVTATLPDGELTLDVCLRCQLTWLGPGAVDRIPQRPSTAVVSPKDLPPEAKVAYAQAIASMWRERQQEEKDREKAAATVALALSLLD